MTTIEYASGRQGCGQSGGSFANPFPTSAKDGTDNNFNNQNKKEDKMKTEKKLRYQNFSNVPAEHGDTDGFNDLNVGMQQERTAITQTQRNVVAKWDEVDERSKGFLGTLGMRGADKKLLKRLDEAKAEATDIILSSRNQCLNLAAQSMVRYNKSLANVWIQTLETGNTVALEGHFMEAKLTLTEKLESLNERMVAILHKKEMDIEAASEAVKPMLKDQGLTLMSTWMDDYEKIIHEFSDIRDRKFK